MALGKRCVEGLGPRKRSRISKAERFHRQGLCDLINNLYSNHLFMWEDVTC